MPTTQTTVPDVILNDGVAIPQISQVTLAVQPDREATQSNIDITAKIVGLALEAGYRRICTAQAYGTERGVGKAIATSGIPRSEIYLTSKLSNGKHKPDDVRRSFAQTLESLGVDDVDLFLIHWPLPTLYDGDYVSTWRAVTEFLAEGTLRSVGVSNVQPTHLDRIFAETGAVPAVDQFELHPYFANTGSDRPRYERSFRLARALRYVQEDYALQPRRRDPRSTLCPAWRSNRLLTPAPPSSRPSPERRPIASCTSWVWSPRHPGD